MGGVARVAIAVCALLTLAACGRDAGPASEPASPSTTAPASSSTVVTSTTGAPTTTLSPEQQDDADIRALHARFYRMMLLTANPPDPDHPEIAATTTGIQRQRSTEFAQQMKDSGEHAVGDLHGNVIDISFSDADHAAVLDCTEIRSSRFSADGSIVGTDDGQAHMTELRVERTSSGWRVEDWFTGGARPCDA
jgi:predicted small lipoprotein YifL